MQEAVLRFFDDLDEEVVRPRLDRIAESLRPFFEYLERQQVEGLADLTVDHVEDFLIEEVPARLDAAKDRKDLWHSMKRFMTWCRRRRYAKELAAAFGKREKQLRWTVLGK